MHSCHICKPYFTPLSAIRLVRLQAPEGAQDMAFYTAAAAAKAARVHDLNVKAHVVHVHGARLRANK